MKNGADKKKVFKETLYGLLRERKITADELSMRLGFARNYLTGQFCKSDGGYAEMSRLQRIGIASILNCTDSDLTVIPVSEKKRQQKPEPETDLGQLMDQMTAGFAILHTDIRDLIEVMEKYWKPEMPTIDRGQGDNRDG